MWSFWYFYLTCWSSVKRCKRVAESQWVSSWLDQRRHSPGNVYIDFRDKSTEEFDSSCRNSSDWISPFGKFSWRKKDRLLWSLSSILILTREKRRRRKDLRTPVFCRSWVGVSEGRRTGCLKLRNIILEIYKRGRGGGEEEEEGRKERDRGRERVR